MHAIAVIASFAAGLLIGIWAGMKIQESRIFYGLVQKYKEHE
jgi:uncharacterized protein YebE (UPF0316 family)